MRLQLLAMVERLLAAIEHVSDLPEYQDDTTGWVRSRTTRQEIICKGYTYREVGDDLTLARMISGMLYELAFWPEVVKRHWQLRQMPDMEIMAQAVTLTKQYYQEHPISEK